jgi:competence protein ComEC
MTNNNMFHKKYLYFSLIFLLAISLILAGIIFYSQSQQLKIIFLDIGQGDSILIEKGSNQILIDGGPSGQKEMEKLGKYIPFWDRKIEIIIATHPDQDHIGGLIDAMENYKVGKIIDTGAKSDSQVYKKYLETINEKNIARLKGEKNMNIKIGEANLEILYPGKVLEDNVKDTNSDSIVAKLVYGENFFLFTGDFPTEKDADMFNFQVDLSAKVLKVSHHGSKYATSEEFLNKVNPQDAVISCGKNNSYGHPAVEILDRLRAKKVNIFRTDERGDIEYDCQNQFSCQMAN